MSDIEIYTSDSGSVTLAVRVESDTVWLTQQQIADLLDTTRENVTTHLRNVYAEGELHREVTSKDLLQVRQEGARSVRRSVTHYNLDAIISVGYRVRSAVATKFRIWATERLRQYLLRGYALDQERLDQLGAIVTILGRATDEMVAGVADILAGYLPGLSLLREFDAGSIDSAPRVVPGWILTLEEARTLIAFLATEYPDDGLFGRERGDGLAGIIGTLYQGFTGVELYPTVEEKAANLLYLVVKDHPLSDGNKRSAAALFIAFLAKNGQLTDAADRPRVSNNALAAITLMVAMSDPKEKDLMIALLVRMLTEGGT